MTGNGNTGQHCNADAFESSMPPRYNRAFILAMARSRKGTMQRHAARRSGIARSPPDFPDFDSTCL
jgi:hypothetical protein